MGGLRCPGFPGANRHRIRAIIAPQHYAPPHEQRTKTVSLIKRVALLGAVAVMATGCASINSVAPDLSTGDTFKNPMACAAAGALLAGGVGAVENREVMAIGAVAGGLLGWWACDQREKTQADADGDGVPDKVDVCADTPGNTKVGANGCPVDGDTDGDGVSDSMDKCAATPVGTKVDENGCNPVADADADGVPDIADLCPNTEAGASVLPNGCEKDSDGDGISDSRDRCPGTPAGVKAGGDGCAVDSDNDGVSDILDRCADTKPGAKVDASGCELPAAPMTKSSGAGAGAAAAGGAMEIPTTAGASIVLTGVTFESGSAKLKPASLGVLDAVATQLKSSGAKVEVSGHTDASGSPAINRALSQRRAESVVAYLAAKGVPSANMTAKGYGPDKPVAPNTSAAGKAKNRRVELQVIEMQ
jgi:OOP family OmpA-OmpF porin